MALATGVGVLVGLALRVGGGGVAARLGEAGRLSEGATIRSSEVSSASEDAARRGVAGGGEGLLCGGETAGARGVAGGGVGVALGRGLGVGLGVERGVGRARGLKSSRARKNNSLLAASSESCAQSDAGERAVSKAKPRMNKNFRTRETVTDQDAGSRPEEASVENEILPD